MELAAIATAIPGVPQAGGPAPAEPAAHGPSPVPSQGQPIAGASAARAGAPAPRLPQTTPAPGSAARARAPPRRAPFVGDPSSWRLTPAVRAQRFWVFFEQDLASSFVSKDTVKFSRARLHTLRRTGIDHSPPAWLEPVLSHPLGLLPSPVLINSLMRYRSKAQRRGEGSREKNLFKSPRLLWLLMHSMVRKVTLNIH